MSAIDEIREIGQQLDDELPQEENDRMAFKCLGAIWAAGAAAMGAEAVMDWVSQGMPANRQAIGSGVIALGATGVSKLFWSLGRGPQETATVNQ